MCNLWKEQSQKAENSGFCFQGNSLCPTSKGPSKGPPLMKLCSKYLQMCHFTNIGSHRTTERKIEVIICIFIVKKTQHCDSSRNPMLLHISLPSLKPQQTILCQKWLEELLCTCGHPKGVQNYSGLVSESLTHGDRFRQHGVLCVQSQMRKCSLGFNGSSKATQRQ